jgi:hypothetical protein
MLVDYLCRLPLSFTFVVHPCCLPLLFTSVVYLCWLPLLFTSVVCPCCLPLLFTSVVYLCCLPVLFTSVFYFCCLHLLFTSVAYLCCVPLLFTSVVYLCCLLLLFTSVVYLCCLPLWFLVVACFCFLLLAYGCAISQPLQKRKKFDTLLDLCVSSLRRGHANLLCIVPILTDDPRRESNLIWMSCLVVTFRCPLGAPMHLGSGCPHLARHTCKYFLVTALTATSSYHHISSRYCKRAAKSFSRVAFPGWALTLSIQTFYLHHCLQAPVLLALFPAWACVWMFTRQGAATYVTVPLRTAGLVKESLQHGPHALTSSIIAIRSYWCQATKQLLM